ncbi:MAG: chromate resistance protein ChrB domain-containing protein, partial [Tistlia sp.]
MLASTTISPEALFDLVGTPDCPLLADVRTEEDFAGNPRLVPGAVRRAALEVAGWPELTPASASGSVPDSVVVICQKGLKLSAGAAAWLRQAGIPARVLEGGMEAWDEARLPSVPCAALPQPDGAGRTLWVTRERPKVDRIACPWLIRRFVDRRAVFLFVPAGEVAAVSERFAATAFDLEGAFWSHRGE